MPSEKEWEEVFARLDNGKSSLRNEAKRLGVSAATVLRRFLKDLESTIQLRRGELTSLEDAVAGAKRELEELTKKYDKEEQEGQARIREKEGRLGELTTKLRLAGQLLQAKHAENQQMDEELSNKSAQLGQLLGRIKEREGRESELNASVQGLMKTRDALEKQNEDLGAERASLEEGNATLRRANSELEGMVKGYLQVIDEMKKAEKQREARASAEFERRKNETDEEIRRWKMEADEDIRKYKEDCKKIAEEGIRKETAERLEVANKDYRHLLQMSEELRIKNIAMGVQLGETSATVELLKKDIKELERRARGLDGRLHT